MLLGAGRKNKKHAINEETHRDVFLQFGAASTTSSKRFRGKKERWVRTARETVVNR